MREITLKRIQDAINQKRTGRIGYVPFLLDIFPKQCQKAVMGVCLFMFDNDPRFDGRRSRFFNGNIRKRKETGASVLGEPEALQAIAEYFRDHEDVFQDMIENCRKIADENMIHVTDELFRLIDGPDRQEIPAGLYGVIRTALETGDAGEALTWLILFSIYGGNKVQMYEDYYLKSDSSESESLQQAEPEISPADTADSISFAGSSDHPVCEREEPGYVYGSVFVPDPEEGESFYPEKDCSILQAFLDSNDSSVIQKQLYRCLREAQDHYQNDSDGARLETWFRSLRLDSEGRLSQRDGQYISLTSSGRIRKPEKQEASGEKESISVFLDEFTEYLYESRIYWNNAARLDLFLGKTFIHYGKPEYIRRARFRLRRALDIYIRSDSYDEAEFENVVRIKWLIAATYKLERNYGLAADECRKLITFIRQENELFRLPYTKTLLLPERELSILDREKLLLEYIIFSGAEDLSACACESYAPCRRLFHYHILSGSFTEAENLLPEVLKACESCRKETEISCRTGFYKDLFEYYSYQGKEETADDYYEKALTLAEENFSASRKTALEEKKKNRKMIETELSV